MLRNSHIIPEFLYGALYNTKNQMLAVRGGEFPGIGFPQKGLREPLFCESCEQHFNETCEKPIRKLWIENSQLPNQWPLGDLIHASFPYAQFKLFHLSVLFRAGVSSLEMFGAVSLGEHEEVLRTLLLNQDPGNHWQYSLFGVAVVHHETRMIVPMILPAEASVFNGLECVCLSYGGMRWWVNLSFHRNREFEAIGLQRDGRIVFGSQAWNEIESVQQLAETVRRARAKTAPRSTAGIRKLVIDEAGSDPT